MFISNFLGALGYYLTEVVPIVLIGFLLSGIIHELIPERFIRKHLGEKGIKSVNKGEKSDNKGPKSGDKGALSVNIGAKLTEKGTKMTENGAKISDIGAKSVRNA